VENQVKVAAVMTAARYEATWARTQIEKALKTLGIPLTVSGGVYYGQCMQKMFESLVKTDCDYVITIDGDTVFTADQLMRLVSIIRQEPYIHAITGLQIRRGKPDLLATVDGKRQIETSGAPVKVATAHFGLTVISIEKLRALPKPWFWATPNERGEWDGSKVDDDVHFWFRWKEAGNSVYLDPLTRLGHLEEMISVYDENMVPGHIYPADWCNE
jgi:hypothetical protein